MKIGIIGGYGAMGSLFAGVFARAGHDVLRSGRRTALTASDLAAQCDCVMVSVPIRETVAVIEEVAPDLHEEQVLCDLTSLKAEPVAAMLRSPAQVIGMHPLFGPQVSSLTNQTIILAPARCREQTLAVFSEMFSREGAHVTLSTPEEHDRMMAVVQALTHFATLALAGTMRRTGVDLDRVLSFTSPVYRIELALIGRILGQDADLYGPILMDNPHVPAMLDALDAVVSDLRGMVESGDADAFRRFFADQKTIFAPYIDQATAESNMLIEALVKQ
ncbi:MAG: prephenate dehydrogenase/arogenate dehydrogenase family protein [Methanomicrobiaceae archaeon]|nr:prephenate dehydrogenase/arogenate dehydrogenase family protein [Methanomicrobiaceae archaeon]